MEERARSTFVQSRLPWLVAAGALLVYVLTLNRWVSLASLGTVSSLTSVAITTPLDRPLHFLITYPFRWLSPGAQILGLNGLAALCGALTLALLARSVALLPHDRTREQRHRERSEFGLLSLRAAWVAPVFAVLMGGLQLTFWEHATSASGEMLDLLLFAYVIRCLLEYRLDERESWLTRMALVYGIALANNYAMIAFLLPVLVAVVWIKGGSFFEARFIGRLLGFGLAGLSLYLLLPLLVALDDGSGLNFPQALRLELAGQKQALLSIPRYLVWPAVFTSLLPIFLMGIRWPSSVGDTSAVGNLLTSAGFKLMHGVFLIAGVYMAFDLPWSARQLMDQLLQRTGRVMSGVPFLTLYYLGALCLGYFAGYFLLVFGPRESRSGRHDSGTSQVTNGVVLVLAWVIVVAAPIALTYRNLPRMQVNNGLVLRDFAGQLVSGLPKQRAVVMSDHAHLLALVQTYLNQTGTGANHLLVDTGLLPFPTYQRQLHAAAPGLWPALPPKDELPPRLAPPALMAEVTSLALSNAVYYLHPSFGYFFESLYLRPEGLVYRLASYTTNEIAPPRLSADLVRRNREYWDRSWPKLEPLAALAGQDVTDARAVGQWCSRALNYWGVEEQRDARLAEAKVCFERASKLNPDNVAAALNLALNTSLQRGTVKRIEAGRSIEDLFGPKFRSWNAVLGANGPVDEPAFCFNLGQLLAQQSLFRQAILQLDRASQLDPGSLETRFEQARLFLNVGLPDQAFEKLQGVKMHKDLPKAGEDLKIELINLEALTRFAQHQTEEAERLLAAGRQRYPKSEALLEAQVQIRLGAERWDDALNAIDQQLQWSSNAVPFLLKKAYVTMKQKAFDQAAGILNTALQKEPDNVAVLLTLSALHIETGQFSNALPSLDKVLKLQPNNQAALLNRAIANLKLERLDVAQTDYTELAAQMPGLYPAQFGLGKIADQRKDPAAAIQHYEAYLKYAPTNTDEARTVADRLRALKAAGK
jgi:lipopolysaccharide biosynthesis regulator YciM